MARARIRVHRPVPPAFGADDRARVESPTRSPDPPRGSPGRRSRPQSCLRARSFSRLTTGPAPVEYERAQIKRRPVMRVTAEAKLATRRRILEAARDCFSRAGFEA